MDNDKYLIAVASSDGIVVNNHFGRASTFYVYEIKEEEIRFIQIRNVEPVCNGGNHDENKLKKNLSNFIDCRYLLVSRIGNGALQVAESYGIEVYEVPGEIEESIRKLIQYKKINDLFR